MSKEKQIQIQEQKNKMLIEELSKMPPMVIATAYLHAINYTLYGEDVTEKWLTATEQAAILEKAYRKGYYDAMEKVNRERESQATDFLAEARACGESEDNCNTCIHDKPGNPYCECCSDMDKYEKEVKENNG